MSVKKLQRTVPPPPPSNKIPMPMNRTKKDVREETPTDSPPPPPPPPPPSNKIPMPEWQNQASHEGASFKLPLVFNSLNLAVLLKLLECSLLQSPRTVRASNLPSGRLI